MYDDHSFLGDYSVGGIDYDDGWNYDEDDDVWDDDDDDELDDDEDDWNERSALERQITSFD